jgi:hypothetical protein
MLAVGTILSAAPRDFAWSQTDFVIEAAEKLGGDCVRAIGSGLHSAAIQGSRAALPRRPRTTGQGYRAR